MTTQEEVVDGRIVGDFEGEHGGYVGRVTWVIAVPIIESDLGSGGYDLTTDAINSVRVQQPIVLTFHGVTNVLRVALKSRKFPIWS